MIVFYILEDGSIFTPNHEDGVPANAAPAEQRKKYAGRIVVSETGAHIERGTVIVAEHENEEGKELILLETSLAAAEPLAQEDIDAIYGVGAPKIVEQNIDQLRTRYKRVVSEYIDQAVNSISLVNSYPSFERASWPAKLAAASNIIHGVATDEQRTLIEAEAALLGTDVYSLAASIIKKAERIAALSGTLAALRRKAYAEIDSSTTEEEIRRKLDVLRLEAEQVLSSILNETS